MMNTNSAATYQELSAENTQLKAMIESLITDSVFGVTTRQGLTIKLNQVNSEIKYICFLDVDNMHSANELYGYEGVNARIKNSLDIRSNDLLIKSRWFSGDEIIIVLREGEPEAFLNRLHKGFVDNGLSITSAYAGYSGDIERDVNICSGKVQASKKENVRGIIVK
jgi:GGDEF domain-containing protein